DKGYVNVRGEIKKSKGRSDYVQIEVEDTGIGISEKDAYIIFEEFGRITSEDGKPYEGTGLGLPITKRIVELLKGSISFSSKYREGSRFSVVLPLQRESKKSNAGTPAIANASRKSEKIFHKERVLLADDDPFLLELTSHILKEANLEVYSFTHAGKALQAIDKHEFDILITDVQMPGTNGLELLTSYKEKSIKPTLAIAVTGDSNDETLYLNAGFNAVVHKPFQPDQLLETVSSVLDNSPELLNETVLNETLPDNSYSIQGIMAFAGGEMETTREILTSFAQSTNENLQQFRLHLQMKDYDSIRKLAHKMLPMFRQLQATGVIEPLRRLEQDYYSSADNEWLLECNKLLIRIDKLMEQIIEDHQLPFSGKLIS
ncbi:MAG: response regulator, partial [Bacteroidota bacterium]